MFIGYDTKAGTVGANFTYQALAIQPQIKVWLDTHELNPAEGFANRLTNHAADADSGISVISRAVLFSDWCSEERRRVLEGSSRIIPVLWDGKPHDYAQLENRQRRGCSSNRAQPAAPGRPRQRIRPRSRFPYHASQSSRG